MEWNGDKKKEGEREEANRYMLVYIAWWIVEKEQWGGLGNMKKENLHAERECEEKRKKDGEGKDRKNCEEEVEVGRKKERCE